MYIGNDLMLIFILPLFLSGMSDVNLKASDRQELRLKNRGTDDVNLQQSGLG